MQEIGPLSAGRDTKSKHGRSKWPVSSEGISFRRSSPETITMSRYMFSSIPNPNLQVARSCSKQRCNTEQLAGRCILHVCLRVFAEYNDSTSGGITSRTGTRNA